ncbi:hypothetical protein MJ575_15945 [Klebsiella pneumoniae]|nr:hypothetical protein MJ575_15945 [Klebsiella pneumoniae]
MVQKIKGRGMVDALSLMPAALPGRGGGGRFDPAVESAFWPRSPCQHAGGAAALLLLPAVALSGALCRRRALRQLGRAARPAARCGASPLQALRLIVLPLVFPALLAAC